MAETVEGMVPLAYAIAFTMAYLGPNGHLIGNVRLGIWAFEAVKDVRKLFGILFALFGIDFLSMVLNGYCMTRYEKANFLHELLQFLQKYWILLAIRLAFDIKVYFGFNDITMGVDMTTKFSWISDDGRNNFINCSTELTEEEKLSLLNHTSFY